MKLVRQNSNTVEFGTFSVGDTFVYHSEVYMRVETVLNKGGRTTNAVKLTGPYSGLLCYFMDSSPVEVFKAVLTESVD